MRSNVYLLLAWRHARLSAALLAVVLIMGACGAFTTIGGASSVPPPGPVSLTVLQRSATLSLSANQTGQATASCQAGEQLLSGGYATTDQTALSAVATPSYHYTQTADFVLDSYPALANGSPPSIQGQSLSSWTVKTAEATPTPLMLTVYANCVKSAAVSTRVYATSAHEVCLVDDPFPQALPASAAASTSAPSTTSSQVYMSAVPNAPARPRSGCGEANQHYQLGCPTSPNFPTLTGGGWRMARGHTTYAVRDGPPGVVIAGQQLVGAFPHQDGPTTSWVVDVTLADADVAPPGTAYVVCA